MNAVAVWLVPAEPWHARLARCISTLASAQGAERFEPHVTLHVGEVDDPHRLDGAVASVCAGVAPLVLQAGATGHSAEHFRTLYIGLADDRLPALQALAVQKLRLGGHYALVPHVSLLYRAGLPEKRRSALAAQYCFSGQQIRFDRLVVVRPAPGRDWSDVRGWDTSLRATLGA